MSRSGLHTEVVEKLAERRLWLCLAGESPEWRGVPHDAKGLTEATLELPKYRLRVPAAEIFR